jgi:hypothetical protein
VERPAVPPDLQQNLFHTPWVGEAGGRLTRNKTTAALSRVQKVWISRRHRSKGAPHPRISREVLMVLMRFMRLSSMKAAWSSPTPAGSTGNPRGYYMPRTPFERQLALGKTVITAKAVGTTNRVESQQSEQSIERLMLCLGEQNRCAQRALLTKPEESQKLAEPAHTRRGLRRL